MKDLKILYKNTDTLNTTTKTEMINKEPTEEILDLPLENDEISEADKEFYDSVAGYE